MLDTQYVKSNEIEKIYSQIISSQLKDNVVRTFGIEKVMLPCKIVGSIYEPHTEAPASVVVQYANDDETDLERAAIFTCLRFRIQQTTSYVDKTLKWRIFKQKENVVDKIANPKYMEFTQIIMEFIFIHECYHIVQFKLFDASYPRYKIDLIYKNNIEREANLRAAAFLSEHYKDSPYKLDVIDTIKNEYDLIKKHKEDTGLQNLE